LFEHLPDNDPSSHRNVEGVFCPELRDLETKVTAIHDGLVNTPDLVTEHNGI
jgi:hypothetical protein